MIEKLKTCPFCKSNAVIYKYTKGIRPRFQKKRIRGIYYCIGCTDPECILYADGKHKHARLLFTSSEHGKDTMIRRWNRRAGDSE